MDHPLADPAARRRFYIAFALKRVRPGAGSGSALLRARTWRQPVFNLTTVFSVPFVVVGGVATRLYAPERTTCGLNVLISADDASQCSEDLARAGGVRVGSLSIGGSEWRLPDGTTLDILEGTASWVGEALASPEAGPDGLPVIGLPYLVLMKMLASRGIDIGDLTRMLGGADEDSLERVRQVIGNYVPDAVEDLESLILLGRLEQGQAGARLRSEG